ncbi:CsgG/HfaB family protein [Mastigocoleus testarum]|uniref:Curli production assembly/transport component CsgG n=1 Tax=Mastigocoleus testarum BC008 TaxID=371196 RepID=A0A0V7ZXE4_9CYAN|nr:CsgG/HfaB family protein [Mastigocoleus testarum]KST69267.1 hypothetical protein BC008_03510 [Mastigocoleus testarum BC008]
MIFFSDSVKNAHLFRRVTSSIIASVFALGFSICSVRSAEAKETKRLKFCDSNKDLFHLNLGAERKVRIAIFDLENNITFTTKQGKQTYPFQGYSDILAGELVKDNNFAVVSWGQVKPFQVFPQGGQGISNGTQKVVTLDKLRDIRNKHGIEAVLIGTINKFNITGDSKRQFLGFGKRTDTNEVYIKLNFRVIDTTTGEVIFTVEGSSNSSKSYTSETTIPKISVDISKQNTNNFDDNNPDNSWNSTKQDSITLRMNLSGDTTENIINSNINGITNKLTALATGDAINQIVDKLNNNSNKLACLLRKPTLVADAEKGQVILNKGKIHGYCKNLKLSIGRKGNLIEDPATERILYIKTEKVGDILLTEVDSNFSVGKIIIDKDKAQKIKVEDLQRDTRNFVVKSTNPESCTDRSSEELPNTSYQRENIRSNRYE